MTSKQPEKSGKLQKPKAAKQLKQQADAHSSKPNSPMDNFNNAMRKILSVPKKDINRK